MYVDVGRGVSKRVEDSPRPPALWVGHPCNCSKAVSGVAYLQDLKGSGMEGPSDGYPLPYAHVYVRGAKGHRFRI
jgi:hypothetical protein